MASSYRLTCVDEEIALSFDNQCASVGEEMEGVVTFGEDWVNFFFQSVASQEILTDLQHCMNELYDSVQFPSITETPAFTNGSPCAARYAKDNRWYRARIIDISYNLVYFVDYGNRQMMNFENVKPLTRPLAELIPPLAYRCKLSSMQNPLLPSFVADVELLKIIIHSKTEPYEVSVQVVSQKRRPVPEPLPPRGNFGGGRQQRIFNAEGGGSSGFNGNMANGFPPPASRLRSEPRRTTAEGLSLPRNFSSSNKLAAVGDANDEDDDLTRMKRNAAMANGSNGQTQRQYNQAGSVSRVNGSWSLIGVAANVSQLFATCGQLSPVQEGVHRGRNLQFNSQETTLRGGSLCVEDLCRVFHVGDRLLCHARYDEGTAGTLFKPSKAPLGFYQVTDLQSLENAPVLITHAIVTFVSKEGAILYVRNESQTIFAPVSSFPERKQAGDLPDFIELGRSVLVRAVPADHFPDLQVSSEWVAQSVELLGSVVESQGWMYFVREAYSVIITEGGIGFGYVFGQNEFVESRGVDMAQWYGTRALFRACMDVPDRDRFGIRWKVLNLRLMPEHSKGAYRYAGVYRPPPLIAGTLATTATSSSASARKAADLEDTGEDFDLPEEALAEMRLMGRDVVGVEHLSQPQSRRAPLKEVVDNLINEQEDPVALARANSTASPVVPAPVAQSASTVTANDNMAVVQAQPLPRAPYILDWSAEDLTLDRIAPQLHSDHRTSTAVASNNSNGLHNNAAGGDDDVDFAADLLHLQNDSIVRYPAPVVSASGGDLIDLWPDIDIAPSSNGAVLLPPVVKSVAQLVNGRCASASAVDAACQVDVELQLGEELDFLRSSPVLMAKVVAYVVTLAPDVQRRFFALLARTASESAAGNSQLSL